MSADSADAQALPEHAGEAKPAGPLTDTITYDNGLARAFLIMTMIWGMVGFVAGLYIALQLTGMGSLWGWQFLNAEWTGFGRLRPLHTNAAIFAFTGNAIFAGVYYSMQRLMKAPLFSVKLGWFHFWSWQLIIVLAAITLPLGLTTSKEYAELILPIDVLIALSWVAFGVQLFGTIARRREKHLYVAIWFYIATWLGITMLHIGNSLALPSSLLHSYPVFAGTQDALMQWWYGHNAVAFFLTTPILGLMYYFLPKAAGRPVYSYKLSILHFWALIFIYIWAGPHHLLYTSLPEWAQTLGMLFSLMLVAPSWAGMLNGLLTLRGAWDKVRVDPILKFFVLAVTAYGMATFEGSFLSIRSVNALSHNTDWTVGHVHNGALGWVAGISFGMIYWMLPRLWHTELYSRSLANIHFWLATVGIILYVVSMWIGGIMQGSMWFAFDSESGLLQYNQWVEFVDAILPYHVMRALGGALFIIGFTLMLWNMYKTISGAEKRADETVSAPSRFYDNLKLDPGIKGGFYWRIHDLIERWPFALTILAAISLAAGGVMEIVPNLVQSSMTPVSSNIQPYTPLELAGRDLYIREGCNACHTQMVRTLRADTARYAATAKHGTYTRAEEHIYDRPHLWGSKRTGPDLAREGEIRSDPLWHWAHMWEPEITSDRSLMPSYEHLYEYDTDFDALPAKLTVLRQLMHPYDGEDIANAVANAKAQAASLAAVIEANPTEEPAIPENLADKEIIAIIAYLRRLGLPQSPEVNAP